AEPGVHRASLGRLQGRRPASARPIVDEASISTIVTCRLNYLLLNYWSVSMSTTSIQQLPAGTYSLDPVHSTFGFAVKHNGVSTFRGQFDAVEATLEDGVLVGTAQVESVNVPIPDLKGHLLSPEFFNATETPTVTSR